MQHGRLQNLPCYQVVQRIELLGRTREIDRGNVEDSFRPATIEQEGQNFPIIYSYLVQAIRSSANITMQQNGLNGGSFLGTPAHFPAIIVTPTPLFEL